MSTLTAGAGTPVHDDVKKGAVNSKLIPFLRSCKNETTQPLSGKITGQIPAWLQGSLVRNGPGLNEIGPDKYQHAFDGLALIHRFCIKDGNATYQNAFLRSTAYQRNMKANRIVVGEFGTAAFPDPCYTLYQRLMSYFSMKEFTDNDAVNILKIGDQYYAATETNYINRIDPESLETKEKVNISDFVAVNQATAHPHYETDGTVINMGSRYSSGRPKYCIIKFPPKSDEKSSFEAASVMCSIPCSSALYPSYYHSFAMTTNYVVFIEQSLVISIPRLLFPIARKVYADNLTWCPDQMVKFHVVKKDTGEILPLKLEAKPFMLFHNINAFEEGDHLVVDMCCYENGDIVKKLYISALEDHSRDPSNTATGLFASQGRRYILPLNTDRFNEIKDEQKKLEFSGSKASAILQKDNTILCIPEVLTEGISFFEFPQINYAKYNGKKYRYFYGVCREDGGSADCLMKNDIETGKRVLWQEKNKTPSEPIFVPSPNSVAEDDGVIVSSLLHTNDDTKVTLLINDAQSLREIARVEFSTTSAVPNDFHGMFIP